MKTTINASFFVHDLSDDFVLDEGAISIEELADDLFFIELEVFNQLNKSNVAIAVILRIKSAITSYSRVHMAKIKLYCIENDIKIFYFDTDSIFTNKPLPDSMIGKELGLLKLEYIFKEAVFLGPKIYAGITIDGNYISKVKGFKNSKEIPFDKMKSLLIKDSVLHLNHTLWFRSFKKSNISLKNLTYEFRATENKRKFIFNENGIAVGSLPFSLIG
jgi:hypothetical protein